MILTAHQPVYIPWLGLFHKIFLAEQFCIFDIAQYQTKDYNNRNLIKTHQGEIWLTVPVESKDHFQKKICDIKIVNNGWNKKHIKSIQQSYQKAKYYKDYIEGMEQILIGKDYEFLTDLNTDILRFMMRSFDIDIPIVKASDYEFTGSKSDLVLDMCIKLRADKYIFGSQGKNYADVESFNKKNVKVYFQEYNHPQYNQLHGSFLPYMSALDLLFNEGPKSKEIILFGNIENI
ncbi:MAG: WbqC family protein [Mucilaginibacter sp.]